MRQPQPSEAHVSVAASSWAWSLKIRPVDKLVLLALADCHNGITGLCCPSVTHLMQMTGLKRRVIFKAFAALKKETLIEVVQSRGHCSKYILTGNIPVHLVHRVVHSVHGGSAPHAPVTGIEPEENPPPNPQRGNGRVARMDSSSEEAPPNRYTIDSSPRNEIRPPAGPPEVGVPFPRISLTKNNGHSTGLAGHYSHVSARDGSKERRNGRRAPRGVSERRDPPKSDDPRLF